MMEAASTYKTSVSFHKTSRIDNSEHKLLAARRRQIMNSHENIFSEEDGVTRGHRKLTEHTATQNNRTKQNTTQHNTTLLHYRGQMVSAVNFFLSIRIYRVFSLRTSFFPFSFFLP
jgi:hypothetical protein